MKIEPTDRIGFDRELHCYTLKDSGRILTPVSSVLDTLEAPFDSEGRSIGMARREVLARYGLTELPVNDKDLYFTVDSEIAIRALQLRQQWDAIGSESMDFGNWIDVNLSAPLEGNPVEPELRGLVDGVQAQHAHYYRELSQFMVFSEQYGICGTMDRLSLRGERTPVVDITDYKTGLNKGIAYDGLKEKDGEKKYYNKFFLEPLDHIEACSYNRYALQLSAYAFLLQQMYPQVRIGRLKICYVSRTNIGSEEEPIYMYTHDNIPVVYLKNDIRMLFERIRISKEMMGVA